MSHTDSRLANCKQALKDIVSELEKKEYARAAESAAFLRSMARDLEHWIRLENGVKAKK